MLLKLCCGEEPTMYFGFSATFKPTTTIICRKCGRWVYRICSKDDGLQFNAFRDWNRMVEEKEENMDEQKKRLIELITAYYHEVDIGLVSYFTEKEAEPIADYLLANGVLAPPCKVGDQYYWVCVDDAFDDIGVYKSEKPIEGIVWDGKEFSIVDDGDIIPLGDQFAHLTEADAKKWLEDNNGDR